MDNITLKDLTKKITSHWIIVLVCLAFSIAVGSYLYKTTPPEYESKVDFLVTKSSDDTRSRLGSLASVAGINLSPPTTGFPLHAIEFVLTSTPFLLDVVKEEIVFENDTVYIGNYLNQRMVAKKSSASPDKKKVVREEIFAGTDSLGSVGKSIGGLEIMELRGKVGNSVFALRRSIEFIKGENKPMTLIVTLQDPEASAMVAKTIMEKLEAYIERYSQDNKADNTDFLKREVEKAQRSLYSAQINLASAKDRNINANRAIANVGIERLTLRYNQAQKTYSDLVMQLEAAKIQVENVTPLFIIIEPPSVLPAHLPTAPRLLIYLILSTVTGVFLALTIIFIKAFYKRNF